VSAVTARRRKKNRAASHPSREASTKLERMKPELAWAIAELLPEPDPLLPREAVAEAVLRYPDTRAALALFPPDGKPREHLFMFRAVIKKLIWHGIA
jgi:hypothetical protein